MAQQMEAQAQENLMNVSKLTQEREALVNKLNNEKENLRLKLA